MVVVVVVVVMVVAMVVMIVMVVMVVVVAMMVERTRSGRFEHTSVMRSAACARTSFSCSHHPSCQW